MDDPVDRVLSEYGLTRDRAKKYVDAIVRANQSETAELVGMSTTAVQNYKQAFDAMSEEERAFLIFNLMDEQFRAQQLLS